MRKGTGTFDGPVGVTHAPRAPGTAVRKKRLPQILDTLIAVGRVRPVDGGKAYVIQ